jgi:hypothetical protein
MIQYALGDAHVQRPAFGLEKEGDLLLNRWRTPLEKVGKLMLTALRSQVPHRQTDRQNANTHTAR